MDNWIVSNKFIYDVHKSLVRKICAGRCWARKPAVVLKILLPIGHAQGLFITWM